VQPIIKGRATGLIDKWGEELGAPEKKKK
jgi:hypothetical protein